MATPAAIVEGASERARLTKLSVAALGIVFGDIGTSPLYAMRQCFFGVTSIPVTEQSVLGVLSLIFWSLILLISIKYLLVVMRADNRGEGGILALLALLNPWQHESRASTAVLIFLGIFGAALLYGDGMLTPAISVLSAVEGLDVAAPALGRIVIPCTLVILFLLFVFQKRGTERIGAVFGPVVIVWFTVLGLLGAASIVQTPRVLMAINPGSAVSFFQSDPKVAFLVLGGVFLVVTGGEALYADMGHFGVKPIRIAWFGLVLPALLANYFGQGAYILAHPDTVPHPFYNLVPHWGVYPMIVLSTVVTVIASQAVISGTFSLMRQAVQLGQSPPLTIVQTSAEEFGQIYVPAVNWLLMIATMGLVIGFGSSNNLAAAYGIAVSATMVITTVLAFFVMRDKWRWPGALVWTIAGFFLIFDVTFLGANVFKIADGGWFPLTIGAGVMLLMTTWRRGRSLLYKRIRDRSMSLPTFLASIALDPPQRIPGSAVFLTSPGDNVPSGLLHHLKLNTILHEQVLLITAVTEQVPRVPAANRLEITPLTCGFYRVFVHYGFMQSPNLPLAFKLCRDLELVPKPDTETTVYYADRATLVPSARTPEMPLWRRRLFAFMAHNSQRAVEFYRLPPGNSVELGIRVEI
jgi:KUP system potassium uptake protein